MTAKLCPSCKKLKSPLHFSGDRTQADGLNRICRDCYSDRQHDRRVKLKFAGKLDERPHLYIPPDSF